MNKDKKKVRKEMLKQATKMMKEEKKKENELLNGVKYKFDLKKNFLKSLLIVLAFITMLSVMVPLQTSNIDQNVKVTVWSIYAFLFVGSMIAYYIYMYIKGKKDFLLTDVSYIEEHQNRSKYLKELELAKRNCKLNKVKFTKEMKEDIKLKYYFVTVKEEEYTPVEDEYITIKGLEKREQELNRRSEANKKQEETNTDSLNNEIQETSTNEKE